MVRKRTSVTLGVFVMFLLINSVFVSAITGSMGNAKMILYPEVGGLFATTIDKSILTKNVNDVPINIKLEADSKAAEFIKIIDKEFVLQPGEDKKATFEIKVRKEGRYEGKINVFFTPLESNNSSKPGVALSSTIIVIASKADNYEESEESDDSQDGESNDVEDEGVSVMTGSAVGDGEKNSVGVKLLSLSTLILVIILGTLLYVTSRKQFYGKKRGRGDGKKRKNK